MNEPTDSPILTLLRSPLVKDMTDEQLREHIKKIKPLEVQAASLRSKLNSESLSMSGAKPKREKKVDQGKLDFFNNL